MTNSCEIINGSEYMERGEIEQLQSARLKEIVHCAYERSPFYKELYDRAGGCAEGDGVLAKRVSDRLKELILARPKEVVILPAGALSTDEQKTKYIIDERGKTDGA